jgi:predicted phosphodiesterase
LVEVETALHKQKQINHKALSDKEARNLLIRAGYSPSKITDEQMASFKKRYEGVDGDVDFARDMAGDIVKEEVESFVHKAKLISNIGEYIYNRIQE